MTRDELNALVLRFLPGDAREALGQLIIAGLDDEAQRIAAGLRHVVVEARNQGLEDFALAVGTCDCGSANCPAVRYASIARQMKAFEQ